MRTSMRPRSAGSSRISKLLLPFLTEAAISRASPLSGTGAQARTKDIAVYASGDAAAYRGIVPVLEGFSRVNYYVGPFGNG